MTRSLFLNKTYSRHEIYGLIEAILFVNGKAYDKKELTRILDCEVSELEKLIDEMNALYKENRRGIMIIPVAHGYQLVTNPHYHQEMKELFGRRNENKLPQSALETLAIIAYRQPISKEEIDKIRGVSSARSLNTLLSLKLITISGTSGDILQTPLYITTERFLEYFRINSLENLPSLSQLEWQDVEDISMNLGEDENDVQTSEEAEEESNLF